MKSKFEKILLSEEDFENLYNQNVKNAIVRYIASLLIGVVATFWVSFFLTDMDTSKNYILIIVAIMGTLTVFAVGFLIYAILTFGKKSLLNKMLKESQINSAWNIIYIISTTWHSRNHGRFKKYLVEFNSDWQCDFFPFMPLDKSKTFDEQMDSSKSYIADLLNAPTDYIKLNFFCDKTNVKFHQQESKEKVIKYSFVNVIVTHQSSYTLKQMQKKFASKKQRRYWKSMDEVNEDINTVKNNFDVLKYIDELRGQIRDFSSEEKFEEHNLRIIWNITNNCGYSCNICATHDVSRNELTCAEKKAVLLDILSKRSKIIEIDFSGGDPLLDAENRSIIDSALDFLGEERVTITTTAKGIHALNDEEKEKYLVNCELTIDIPPPSSDGANSRGDVKYYESNKSLIELDRSKIRDLQINIPILRTDISDHEIKTFIEEIRKMNPSRITLIRLMPVGKRSISEYPKPYNPTTIINLFKENLDEVNLNCALRVKYEKNEMCTMLTDKIGIDCAGNVFACGWAGYICEEKDVKNNPFYLGNLLKQSFSMILESQNAKKINARCNSTKGNCPIFSYLHSDGDMFSNTDSLTTG